VSSAGEDSRATPATPSTLPVTRGSESMCAETVARPTAPAPSPTSVNGPTRASSSGTASFVRTGASFG
jgi:hypothetical protein